MADNDLPYVQPFSALDATKVAYAGGKGATLARLFQAGLPVPPGCVLSPEACALYLFLVTVADAQGLSFYSDRSLCARLSMTPVGLGQARQALVACALVAYQRPLYQVLALDAASRAATPSAATVAADDDPVDIQAVFARIWEVLS